MAEKLEEPYIMDSVIRDIIYKFLRLSTAARREIKRKYPDCGIEFSRENVDKVIAWIREEGIENEFWSEIREVK